MESRVGTVVRAVRLRLIRCGLAAAVVVGLLSMLGVAAAQAEPVWVSGTLEETNIMSCIQMLSEKGTGAYLSYLEPEGVPPVTGQVYYVAVTVAGLGNTCSGTIYNPQIKLPAGTEPAVSPENPVYCFASPQANQPAQLANGMCAGIEQLSNGNVQIDSNPAWAGTFNGSPIAPFFPIAQGYFEEEHFPVVSTQPLNGSQKIESAIATTDEGGQTLRPWVIPIVEPAPVPPAGGGGGGTGGGGTGGTGGASGAASGSGTSGTPPPPATTGSAQPAGSTAKPPLPKCRRGFTRKVIKIRRHGKVVRGQNGKPRTKVVCVKKARRHSHS
jgi:hypothetical protein